MTQLIAGCFDVMISNCVVIVCVIRKTRNVSKCKCVFSVGDASAKSCFLVRLLAKVKVKNIHANNPDGV